MTTKQHIKFLEDIEKISHSIKHIYINGHTVVYEWFELSDGPWLHKEKDIVIEHDFNLHS